MTAPTSPPRVDTVSRPDPDQHGAIHALVEAATSTDGVRPVSEQVLLRLRYDGQAEHRPEVRHVLAWAGDSLVGYAQLDGTDPVEGPVAEMAVGPAARGTGVGRRLVTELLRASGRGLRIWAHGDLAAAAMLAEHLGFTRSRVLRQLRRPLSTELPSAELPAGVTVRTFRLGEDEQRWLDVNARAFADHPEQGRLTLADLTEREREPWFDPAGFFLAFRAFPNEGELIGFHWTKVEDGLGEVYVVGVDPAARGLGLGRALTLIGLHHLRALGLSEATLYVDDTNRAALAVYETLGFSRYAVDVCYAHR